MDIDYRFENTSNEETVLLLHGFLSDMYSMEMVADRLKPHYNILMVDLPGFGNTRSAGIDYSMDDVARGIAALIHGTGLGRVHVLGYSMGGRVAVSLMVNHPECLVSAVLESTSPGLEDMHERQSRFEVDRSRAGRISSDYNAFIDDWEQMGLFETQKDIDTVLQERQRENRLGQKPDEVADSLLKYGTGAQESYWHALDKVDLPVLLLAGEKDEKFISINRRMDYRLPDSQLIVIEGAGHNIHMEAAEKFGTIVLEFLIGG